MNVDELVSLVSGLPRAGTSTESTNTGRDSQAAESPSVSTVTELEQLGERSALTEQMGNLARQIELLRGVQQDQADATGANTRALIEGTSSRMLNGVSTAARGALGILGGGALAPWIPGLLRLFGGGSSEQPQSLVTAERPQPLRIDETVAQNARASNPSTALPAITVNVQAFDSRSFVDHSSDIADALRRALLEAHSVQDVLGEL